MSEKSSFFNSVGDDRNYFAEDFAEYFNSFIGNGVFPNPSTGLQIISNNDMTVTDKAGRGWINGYMYINTDNLILPIAIADGLLNRIDRIVMRFDTVGRAINIVIKKGVFASSPVAPSLQRDADGYELGLADIYIGKGATSITQANITDLRLNNSFCGIVTGVVEQVDTTTLFNEYQTWLSEKKNQYNTDLVDWTNIEKNYFLSFLSENENLWSNWFSSNTLGFSNEFTEWFNGIKGLLSGDATTNIINYVDALETKYKLLTSNIVNDLSVVVFQLSIKNFISTSNMKHVFVDNIESVSDVHLVQGMYLDGKIYI